MQIPNPSHIRKRYVIVGRQYARNDDRDLIEADANPDPIARALAGRHYDIRVVDRRAIDREAS